MDENRPAWAYEPPTLCGDRVVLRALRESDIDAIVATCRDPEWIRWTTIPDPYGRRDAQDFLARLGPDGTAWRSGTGAGWAIADDTDRYSGTVDLRLDGKGGAEVGYGVSAWARGHGMCTEALRLACRWAFEVAAVERIEWHAFVGNDASRRVARKVGFLVHDEVLRRRGRYRGTRRDEWIGDLLPSDLR